MNHKGVLLLNLGTPDHCDVPSVRKYLNEFLSDPRVVDIPAPARWLLLNAVILPTRPRKSAAAYEQIWTQHGSPLLYHSKNLATAVAQKLGDEYEVALGMRYGNPSIASALQTLAHCHTITILPLFPQYSAAATGSATAKALNLLTKQWNIPEIRTIRDFYDDPGFIHAYARLIQRHIYDQTIDLLLFSYHGLPERHINKSQCHAHCDRVYSCPAIGPDNAFCYRAQCYATSHALANALSLKPEQYQVAFQSRLGRTPWIKPYTDSLLPKLRKNGIENIAIVCPSFVADCLETLEEIGIRAKKQWEDLGGKQLIAVPCLNAEPDWVDVVAGWVRSG